MFDIFPKKSKYSKETDKFSGKENRTATTTTTALPVQNDNK